MPYFCEYPKCRCHIWLNDERQLLNVFETPNLSDWSPENLEKLQTETVCTKEIGHREFRYSNRNNWDYFYLCDECVEKLTEQNFLNNPELTRWYHKRTMR